MNDTDPPIRQANDDHYTHAVYAGGAGTSAVLLLFYVVLVQWRPSFQDIKQRKRKTPGPHFNIVERT